MLRFCRWLKNNDYINQEKFDSIYSTINEKKDSLPKAAELSDLIYDESIKNELNKYSSYEEGNYAVTKIKPGKLWVKDYMEAGEEIGPVVVPKKITDLAERDFFVYLELGKKNGKYYIVNSGNVYPIQNFSCEIVIGSKGLEDIINLIISQGFYKGAKNESSLFKLYLINLKTFAFDYIIKKFRK